MARYDHVLREEALLDGDWEAAVIAAGGGDRRALATLYREFHPQLLGYLQARAPRAGEDLASDTWVRVADSLPSFTGDASGFRSWLFTIARCRLIDHRRRSGRRGEVLGPGVLATRPADDDPEGESLTAISADGALAAIRRLSPDQADAILLRVMGGLRSAEVAAAMGKQEGTIRVLQHRGLRRLAKILEDDP